MQDGEKDSKDAKSQYHLIHEPENEQPVSKMKESLTPENIIESAPGEEAHQAVNDDYFTAQD